MGVQALHAVCKFTFALNIIVFRGLPLLFNVFYNSLVGLKGAECSNDNASPLKCASLKNFNCDVNTKSCQCAFPYVWDEVELNCIKLKDNYYLKDDKISRILSFIFC